MSLTTLKITLSKTLKVWSDRSWLGRFLELLDRPGAMEVRGSVALFPCFGSFISGILAPRRRHTCITETYRAARTRSESPL